MIRVVRSGLSRLSPGVSTVNKHRLAVAVLLALGLAVAAPAQPPQPRFQPIPNQPPGRAADPALNPIPTDCFAFVSVKAAKLWDNPATKPFRDWVAAQKDAPLDVLFGVPPADIDRVTAFVATADPDNAAPLVLVTTRQQYNETRVLKALGVGKNDGPPGRRVFGRVAEIRGGAFAWVAFLDDRTMLFLPTKLRDEAGPALIAQLVARKADGPLAAALIEAQAHDFAVGLDVRGLGAFAGEFGWEADKRLVPYLALLKARTATLTADFDRTARVRLVMSFPDAETARRAAPVLEEGMKFLASAIGGEKGEGEPLARIAAGWGTSVLKGAKVTVEGANVVAAADVPYADDLAKAVAALPKSLNLTRDTLHAQGNLKQLALAMHNFESAYQFFPSDIAPGGDKAPVMSWRVQILPFIEQDNLYKQLDHMKPWDDPKNLKALEAMEMPKIFERPGRPAPKGHTYFRVFTLPKNAKGTDRPFFAEGKRGPRITDITDGTSNTLMIVEAGEAVPWYKPDVLPYDGKLPLPQLGDKEADSFLVAMGDGSVRKLKPSKLGEKTLRALITINGGEVVADLDK
jgi:hypothetical protein